MNRKWINILKNDSDISYVQLLARTFKTSQNGIFEFVYAADERCVIYLDGKMIERSTEHGDPEIWFSRKVSVQLGAGEHLISVQLFCYNGKRQVSQLTTQHGFFMESATVPELNSSNPGWYGKILPGIVFLGTGISWGCGSRTNIDGPSYEWGFENKIPDKTWNDAVIFENNRNLVLSELPQRKSQKFSGLKTRHVMDAMKYNINQGANSSNNIPAEVLEWDQLLEKGKAVSIPPRSRRRIIIDFKNYVCGYYKIKFSEGRGGKINLNWQESYFNDKVLPSEIYNKGNRGVINNKYMHGASEAIFSGGQKGCAFESYWWISGRYVQLIISTLDQAMKIEGFELFETGHDFQNEFKTECDSVHIQNTIKRSYRTMQACSHDTYVDCPFYEQLMYIGDSRIEALCNYIIERNAALPERSIRLFASSQQRNSNGMICSRWPSRDTQIIPIFPMIYCGMLNEHYWWRGNEKLIKDILPSTRRLMEYFHTCIRKDGLIFVPGWNFVDWIYTPGWDFGTPPDGKENPCSIINAFFINALLYLAELEEALGDAQLAVQYRKTAERTSKALIKGFYSAKKGLMATELAQTDFAEHAQIAALLTGMMPADIEKSLTEKLFDKNSTLTKPELCFTHYYFEACRKYGRMDRFFKRLELWKQCDKYDLFTVPENLCNTRSDAHAWGSHPMFHYFASVLGIRPAAPGFSKIEIKPAPGILKDASGTMPHPQGLISVAVKTSAKKTSIKYEIPENVPAVLNYNGEEINLNRPQGNIEFKK